MKKHELIKKLALGGCYFYKEGKNHELWYSPITHQAFPITRHDSEEIAKGTLRAIERESGVKL